MRLIDAEHLKRWIMMRWESGVSVGYDDVKTNEILEQIDRELTINPEPRWIPCSERLPEEDHWLGGSGRQFSDKVLVSIFNSADKDEWVDASYTIDGEWTLELPRDCKVIAWEPLPEPYQEVDE